MNPGMTQAATEAAARVATPSQLYRTCPAKSIAINEILSRLVFSLESLHTTVTERTSVLCVVDQLLRLKVDLGLLKEVHHVQ